MNTKIIEKALSELQQATPDLSYVRGMLETLLAMSEVDQPKNTSMPVAPRATDEASILDAQARASVAAIKELSEKSLEK